MTNQTPADELRAAAEKLRALADAATPGPWEQTGIGDYGWTVTTPGTHVAETDDSDRGRADADWIAAMHPGVGLALADWLDLAATEYDPAADVQETDRSHDAALAVARAVLGRPAVPAATSSEGEQ